MSYSFILAIGLLLLTYLSVSAAAQSDGLVTAEVNLDTTTARIAEPITLTARFTAEPGVEVVLPDLDETWGPFQIVEVNDHRDLPAGDQRQWQRKMVFESYEAGTFDLPDLGAKLIDRRFPDDPVTAAIPTEAVQLTITSTLEGEADPLQFRDIKEKLTPEPEVAYGWFWPTVISTCAAGLLLAGALLMRRRAGRTLTPQQQAEADLQQLIADQPPTQEFYTRLSTIVRTYLEAYTGLAAPRQTTPEFIQQVRQLQQVSDEDKRLLNRFLTAMDLIKFARHEPGAADRDEALQAAKTLIAQHGPASDPSKEAA